MAKVPQSKEEIKSFVGLCNFFGAQIKDFAKICEPLKKQQGRMQSTPKDQSLSEPIMAYPRSNLTYALIVDSSKGTDKV
jgi:hypothetical protein